MEYYFIIPLFITVVTQFIKWLKNGLQNRVWSLSVFIQYGGMPSSHAALIGSMLWLFFRLEAVNQVSFIVAVALSFVVLRDAVGLRRKISPELGHSFLEVFVGLLVGVSFTEIIFLLV